MINYVLLLLLLLSVDTLAESGKPKVFVGLFGVVARSISYTWPQIDQMIIKPLEKKGYQPHIVLWNLDVGSTLVDQQVINNADIKIIPYNALRSAKQSNIDSVIDQECPKKSCAKWVHTGLSSTNALRQMYAEYSLGKWLATTMDDYAFSIVIGPDFYPLIPLELDELNTQYVYTSVQGDYSGVTNGFLVGSSKHIAKLLMRYDDFIHSRHIIHEASDSYEIILAKYFQNYAIPRRITNMVFCKMRANKICRWPGKGSKSPAVSRLSQEQKSELSRQICKLQKSFWLYTADIPSGWIDTGLLLAKEKLKGLYRAASCLLLV